MYTNKARVDIIDRTKLFTVNWATRPAFNISSEYVLTPDEKENLSEGEQEVWKALKTQHVADTIEDAMARILSEEIAKEIDADLLKNWTSYAAKRK